MPTYRESTDSYGSDEATSRRSSKVVHTDEGPSDESGALLRDPAAKRNVGVFLWRSFTHIVPAVFLGFVIDKCFKFIQTKLKLVPIVLIIVQLIVSVVILYIIEKYLSPKFAEAWLNATPGTLFVLFYFGVQFNLFEQFVATGKGNGLLPPIVEEPAQQKI